MAEIEPKDSEARVAFDLLVLIDGMNIASLISAKTTNNNIELKVKDSDGRERTLNLSPRARDQMIQAILTAPMIDTRGGSLNPFIAANVRLTEDGNAQLLLEVTVGPRTAIHIQLPRAVADGLRKLLTDWVTPTH